MRKEREMKKKQAPKIRISGFGDVDLPPVIYNTIKKNKRARKYIRTSK